MSDSPPREPSKAHEDEIREKMPPPSTPAGPEHIDQPYQDDPSSAATESKQVTDPVTHLPIIIHDNTSKELEQIPPPPGTPPRQPRDEKDRAAETQKRHAEMQQLVDEETKNRWIDPEEADRKKRVLAALVASGAAGVGGLVGLLWTMGVARKSGAGFGWLDMLLGMVGCVALGGGVGGSVFTALGSDAATVPDGHPSEQKRDDATSQTWTAKSKAPESAAWLNAFLGSVWPLINPALFVSLCDTLEDVMQQSLPKLVKGIRVADLGQGSEPIRFLGIRWLEAGDATISKGSGMAAEEGDFVNLEVAVAYRGRPTKNSLKSRNQNAHLLMEFFSVGGVRLPVWVQITGILATARIRLQLTPDPPFLSLMTLTLLGQPKVTMSCVPLAKNFLNIMDIPGISNFVQSCIDEAVSAYVAPRSLTLDLQEMLVGPDFKTDTEARGVVVVRVIKSEGFKDGDGGKAWLRGDEKHGDPYVTVGWGKWGKAIWATRILQNESHPVWDETTALLITPAELNAEERLRLQLWDSDRTTADDLLGEVNVPLKELIDNSSPTFNGTSTRTDRLTDPSGKPLPGTLHWTVGYYAKTAIDEHLSAEEASEVKRQAVEAADAKLTEAKGQRNEKAERKQEEKEETKERSDKLIATRAPHEDWPSGILGVQIHNIVGLEIENVRSSGVQNPDNEDEESDDLPSPYCTMILNQKKVYKTRTKLKSNKPFFNAGTEKFVRDWKTAEVLISVRDSRLHENDPLIGVVRLPLHETFKAQSQVNGTYPLVGGVGHGRVRISMIFRSVQARLPRELRGWDVGTLEVQQSLSLESSSAAHDLHTCHIVMRTSTGKGKFIPSPSSSSGAPAWDAKHGRPVRIPIKKRYPTSLAIQFRKRVIGPDQTPAFAVLWLKDIPDETDVQLSLSVYRNFEKAFEHASVNAEPPPQAEQIATLKLSVRFWAGLSGYHSGIAGDDNGNMRDVMAALDCAQDEEGDGGHGDGRELDDVTSSSSGESESDIEEEERLRNDRHRGLVDQAREYKRNRKSMERKHRGLMQWSGVRNLAWAADKAEAKVDEGKDKFMGRFRHREREEKVDTEV